MCIAWSKHEEELKRIPEIFISLKPKTKQIQEFVEVSLSPNAECLYKAMQTINCGSKYELLVVLAFLGYKKYCFYKVWFFPKWLTHDFGQNIGKLQFLGPWKIDILKVCKGFYFLKIVSNRYFKPYFNQKQIKEKLDFLTKIMG